MKYFLKKLLDRRHVPKTIEIAKDGLTKVFNGTGGNPYIL